MKTTLHSLFKVLVSLRFVQPGSFKNHESVKQFLVLVTVMFGTGSTLLAQTTWNGSAGTVWTNAANWSAGVPDASDDVTIPNVTNDPTISASGAVAKSVIIQSGGVLTIGAAGTLAGTVGGGNYFMLNSGTVTNSGAITVDAAIGIGISNYGVFSNPGGQITINKSTTNGIANKAGTFTNTGTISIGNLNDIGINGISNDAAFNNNTGGQINIDRANSRGIENNTGSTFTNQATIVIGATASTGTYGIDNSATFNNNIGGQINIDRASATAFFNNTGGSFTNNGGVTAGALAAIGSNGIHNKGIFKHNSGTIRLDQSAGAGILNDTGGELTNQSTILIGQTTSPGLHGIFNSATINNNGGGQITIDRSTNFGFRNVTGGIFTNRANITIGSTASVGSYGISNWGTCTNISNGQIAIDRSSNTGLLNYTGSSFTNQAKITIGSISSVGSYGIRNLETFNNSTGGQIHIDRSPLRNEEGTFTNAASITIGATVSPGTTALENSATFINQTGGQINADRSTLSGVNNTGSGTFTNHATINVGITASTGGKGINNLGSSVFNNSAGAININNSTSAGIDNGEDASFNNLAAITIGPVSTGTAFISNSGEFNHKGGQITMNGSPLYGILNYANATFTSEAPFSIASTSGTISRGIENQGTFNNNTGSTVQIDRCTNYGIYNNSTFNNSANITIGGITSAGLAGIYGYKSSAFTNNAGGLIKIDRCTTYGIDTEKTFKNEGTITIGSTESAGTYGIRVLGGLFENKGNINVDRTTTGGIVVVGDVTSFDNFGTIKIGATASVGDYGIFFTVSPALVNKPGAKIYIDRAGIGIYATIYGSFDNLGDVTIGALSPISQLIKLQGNMTGAPIFNHALGTLKGTGSISSGFLNYGGTLAPGYSPGIMTLAAPGNALFMATLAIEVNGKGTEGINYDQIVGEDGIANLTGATLALSINYTPTLGDQIKILSAPGIKGPFKAINGLPTGWVVNYTSTAVILSYGSGPLPVTLFSFTGKSDGKNQNLLKWITADEKDFDRFEVQRSSDARSFETIGVVFGQKVKGEEVNESGILNTYTFTDLTAGPSNYYRLKMRDKDGSFDYSRIISIENSAEQAVVGSFYPNPSNGKVFVDVYAVESGSWTLTVIEPSGKIIGTRVHDLKKGMKKISVHGLSTGLNLVRFEHGQYSEVRKLVTE
jgi:hypothetical protein